MKKDFLKQTECRTREEIEDRLHKRGQNIQH